MTLHREIYWVGKQWAVTGHGIQACNQKQRGRFDIEASRLWEDGVQDAVRAQKWVDTDDFETAVIVARKYYPEPPRKTPPPKKPVVPVEHVPPPPLPPISQPPPKLAAPKFEMRVEGLRAKWLPVWRIRMRVAARPGN
jgi:hypothetical protein